MNRGARMGVIGWGALPGTSFCDWRVSVGESDFDAEINEPGSSATCHAEERQYFPKDTCKGTHHIGHCGGILEHCIVPVLPAHQARGRYIKVDHFPIGAGCRLYGAHGVG